MAEHPVDRLPAELSSARAKRTAWENRDVSYEIAVAGLPFLSAASGDRPIRRGLAEAQKQQIDLSDQPGDQSFSQWWVSSQVSFLGGAGNMLLDKEDASNIRPWQRFRNSAGVNVWESGVALLNQTRQVGTPTAGMVTTSGANSAIWASIYEVIRVAGDGSYRTYTVEMGDPIADVASANGKVLLARGENIYTPTGLNYGDAWFPDDNTELDLDLWLTAPGDIDRLWFVKQRVFAAVGAALYEVGLSATTWPTEPVAEGGAGWAWTGLAETAGAVLAAGHDGIRSSVYALTVDPATGQLPELVAPYVVADLPTGELCNSLGSYLGSTLVFCTTRGVRVGQVGGSNMAADRVAYGPLLEPGKESKAVAFRDRFAWVGTADGQADGGTGLKRLDLSNETDQAGRVAWADDLCAVAAHDVVGVAVIASTGLAVIATDSGLFIEYPGHRVASGWLETHQIRFGTLVPKWFEEVQFRGLVHGGRITASTVDEFDTATSIAVMGRTNEGTVVATIQQDAPVVRLGLKFTIERGEDEDSTPQFASYQVRALPAFRREELWNIPVLCFDEEEDRFGVRSNQPKALDRYRALRDRVRDGGRVMVQDLTTGESALAVVEGLSFEQRRPPQRASGFGGIVTITVRVMQ